MINFFKICGYLCILLSPNMLLAQKNFGKATKNQSLSLDETIYFLNDIAKNDIMTGVEVADYFNKSGCTLEYYYQFSTTDDGIISVKHLLLKLIVIISHKTGIHKLVMLDFLPEMPGLNLKTILIKHVL